jgi:lysophospholipase L1-like esterase
LQYREANMPNLLRPLASALLLLLLGACAAANDDDPSDATSDSLAAGSTERRVHSLANLGDSISQGFDADDAEPLDLGLVATHPEAVFHDQPQLSWVQGTDPRVGSVALHLSIFDPTLVVTPLSRSGAEVVGTPGGIPNLERQARALAGVTPAPDLVYALIGGNDVCNRPRSATDDPTATMYPVGQWRTAVVAALDALAVSLPSAATVRFSSMPRVDLLRDTAAATSIALRVPAPGHPITTHLRCSEVWSLAERLGHGICSIVTTEPSAARRAEIGRRIDAYNEALADEVHRFDGDRKRNPRGVVVQSDWRGSLDSGSQPNSSLGTFAFAADDISKRDCFHPSIAGQRRIAEHMQSRARWAP